MANKDISKYARSKRGVYPKYLEARVEHIGALTRAYLNGAGAPALSKLGEDVGASAASTLANRIAKGTLTLKDMILIQRKYPVDWSGIITAIAATISDEEVECENNRTAAVEPKKQGYRMKSSQEDREAFLALLRNGGEAQTQWGVG